MPTSKRSLNGKRSNRNNNRPRRRRRRRGEVEQVTTRAGRPGGIGSQLGSAIGNWAEGGLRSLFGSGDYETEYKSGNGFKVEDNSIVEPLSAANVPLLNTSDVSKDGMMRVKHREYFGDFNTGTVAGTPPGYFGNFRREDLTPQNSSLFPWLSTIAGNFEQWIPHGIVFEFVSTCGNAVSSSNAALGSISIATQYNVYTSGFKDKTTMLNHYFGVSGKTSDNVMHAIECNPEEVQMAIFNTYDNNTPPTINGDARMYILGQTTFLGVGSQAIYTAGELWVTYDITLMKPRINISAALTVSIADEFAYMIRHGISELSEQDHLILLAEAKEREESDLNHDADIGDIIRAGTNPPPSPSPIHERDFNRWTQIRAVRDSLRGPQSPTPSALSLLRS
jgi:hypothetical protein